MHPLRPLTGERISLKVVTFSIEKITMECEGGVRLKTSLTVSFQPDVDNLTNFYLQTGAGSGDLDIIKSVTKQKVSSMMAIVNSYKYKDVLGEKQNEIIKKIQGAFDDSVNFTDPDDTARQESARKLEVDTGIQILRIDFGDIDHEDPKIAEAASQKMMNKMIKESAEEFKDIPKDDIENALMAAEKVKGFIIRGGSGIEAAQLERSVGRVD
jgi:regulator of protease activity HflC (stomatin/prohibitin superfamily)